MKVGVDAAMITGVLTDERTADVNDAVAAACAVTSSEAVAAACAVSSSETVTSLPKQQLLVLWLLLPNLMP